MPDSLETHWEGLKELPDDVLTRAVLRALKTRTEFPTPVELRQDADASRPPLIQEEPDRSVPLEEPREITVPQTERKIAITHAWTYYCDVCNDSGKREWWCGAGKRQAWIEDKRCELPKCKKLGEDYGHSWVEDCHCIDWNPEIKKRKERDARYAEAAATKGKH